MSAKTSLTKAWAAYDPDLAVDELIVVFPNLAGDREKLLVIFKLAWRGEWPIKFYSNFYHLYKFHPWLGVQIQKLLGLSDFPSIHIEHNHDLYNLSRLNWKSSHPGSVGRVIDPYSVFEGLLLLSSIRFSSEQNEYAHLMLGRLLDLVERGVISGGENQFQSRRRHPLKKVFRKVGHPQTIERLAYALNEILPEVKSLYPRVGTFLESTVIPLACDKPTLWVCPTENVESDVLDADKPPHTNSKNNLSAKFKTKPNVNLNDDLLPEILKRKVTAGDLVNEMLNCSDGLKNHEAELLKISVAWRGEYSLQFFNAVAEITLRSPWLESVLQKIANETFFVALREVKKNTDYYKNFIGKSIKWREQEYLEPIDNDTIPAKFEPKTNEHGLNLLRGLLFLGRIEWEPAENAEAQDALINLIDSVVSADMASWKAQRVGGELVPQHPFKKDLDTVGLIRTPEQVVSELERILPELAKFDTKTANYIGQVYYPLLGAPQMERFLVDPEPKVKRVVSNRISNKKRKPRSSKIRQLRLYVPNNTRPLTGESIEETAPSISVLRSSEPSKVEIPLKEEILWAHQRIYGTNQLLVRNHIENLSDAEALPFVRALKARISQNIAEGDAASAWIGVFAALTMVTGQGVGTWTALEVCLNDISKEIQNYPLLIVNKGIFRLPVVRPDGAFRADDTTRSMLEVTSQTVDLHLPTSLHCLIESILKLGPAKWPNNVEKLKRDLEKLVGELDSSVGTGITLARVRLVAKARIHEVTNDLASTMILCGDTFGISTAPLYYANLNVDKLEQYYREATWPLFDDQPVSHYQDSIGLRVGSELLLTHDAARSLAMAKSDFANKANSKCTDTELRIRKHNSLVDHILKMLMGAAGHRPTSALFELKRFDFDTTLHAAVFADKQCDPAHLYRFLPTADLVSIQIDIYLNHLRALAELSETYHEMAEQAKAALLGYGQLFFYLSNDSVPFVPELSSWRKSLPLKWQTLPLNWGRTWLSSRGREAGIDADHLSIMLGHLDATGYPFSKESPLEPAQLSRAISSDLGKLAKYSGWNIRTGLKPQLCESNNLHELGALKNWATELTNLTELTKKYEVKQRQVLRSALRGNLEEGENIAISALESVLKLPLDDFKSFKQSRTNIKTPELDSTVSIKNQNIYLSNEDLENIQNKIEELGAHNKILAIAAHNALHRYLKNAKKILNWDCSIPSPWLAPATLEPSPFFPGIFKATSQINAIRKNYRCIPVNVPMGLKFSPFEWACGQAIIALCVFGFNEVLDEILDLLSGRETATRNNAIKDLVFFEIGMNRRVVGIRGIAAIALTRLAVEYPNTALPDINRLNLVVAAQLPPALVGDGHNVITRLCATVSATNIVELSGLARMALKSAKGSVAMSIARQRQMLEEGYGDTEHTQREVTISDDVLVNIPSHKCASSTVKKQYRQLCEVLYIGDGPKNFKITGVSLSQANITAFRNPLCDELTAFLKFDELDTLVSCIGAFALHMTRNGTFYKKSPAWSTVYGYITSIGLDLINMTADLDFMGLDTVEYIDLYQDIIDRKGFAASKELAARELVNFHRYLHKYHGFEYVDFSDLEGIDIKADVQVDAEVIQPKEYMLGMEHMSSCALAYDLQESANIPNLRLNRQGEVYALLLGASGARHNELTALLYKDVLATADSIVLFIRPSRYRRLKTSAGRRMVDISKKLTFGQRELITRWIEAEKARLGSKWKPTLPIFSELNDPKIRAPSNDLREVTLSAMETSVGCRTKIHRARHKVVCEDLLSILLSKQDWHDYCNSNILLIIPANKFTNDQVTLPKQIKKLTLEIGHTKFSTTAGSYFHLPWAVTSRAHQALIDYMDCHAASVALGTSYDNASKISYRYITKSTTATNSSDKSLDAWLTHIIGAPTRTPGNTAVPVPCSSSFSEFNPLNGRIIERILRDIQRGLPNNDLGLAHGLTNVQLDRLKVLTDELQLFRDYSVFPESKKQRSVRIFKSARPLEGILDIVDRDENDSDRKLVLSIALAYIQHNGKSNRNNFILPDRYISRLVRLLEFLDVSESKVVVVPSATNQGFSRIYLLRSKDAINNLNIALSWYLIVAHIVATFNEPEY